MRSGARAGSQQRVPSSAGARRHRGTAAAPRTHDATVAQPPAADSAARRAGETVGPPQPLQVVQAVRVGLEPDLELANGSRVVGEPRSTICSSPWNQVQRCHGWWAAAAAARPRPQFRSRTPPRSADGRPRRWARTALSDPPLVHVHGITRNLETSAPEHRRNASDASGLALAGARSAAASDADCPGACRRARIDPRSDRSTICSSLWNQVPRPPRVVGSGCSHPTPTPVSQPRPSPDPPLRAHVGVASATRSPRRSPAHRARRPGPRAASEFGSRGRIRGRVAWRIHHLFRSRESLRNRVAQALGQAIAAAAAVQTWKRHQLCRLLESQCKREFDRRARAAGPRSGQPSWSTAASTQAAKAARSRRTAPANSAAVSARNSLARAPATSNSPRTRNSVPAAAGASA